MRVGEVTRRDQNQRESRDERDPNWLALLLQFISGQNAHSIFLFVAHSNIIASVSI